MLNWSIFVHLHDFFSVISLVQSTSENVWACSCHFTIDWLHNFQLPQNSVSLSKGHRQTGIKMLSKSCLSSYQIWMKSVSKASKRKPLLDLLSSKSPKSSFLNWIVIMSSSSSAFPSYISVVHHFGVRLLLLWPFFNPSNHVEKK